MPKDGERAKQRLKFSRHLREGEQFRINGLVEFYKRRGRWELRLVEPGEIDVKPPEKACQERS